MADRIAAHRARRGPFWRTVEAPLLLAEAVGAVARPDRPVLVDCLTLWLSNLMLAEARLDEQFANLRRRCAMRPGRSCWLPTRSGSGWCRKPRSAAGSATRPAG